MTISGIINNIKSQTKANPDNPDQPLDGALVSVVPTDNISEGTLSIWVAQADLASYLTGTTVTITVS